MYGRKEVTKESITMDTTSKTKKRETINNVDTEDFKSDVSKKSIGSCLAKLTGQAKKNVNEEYVMNEM